MWRRALLVRKGFHSKHKVSPKLHAPHQVLPLSSSSVSIQLSSSQSSSHFTTWVSEKPIFSHKLRLFSTDSSVESPVEAPPGSDLRLESDGNPVAISSAVDPNLDFDENPVVAASESDQNVSATNENLNDFGVNVGDSETLLSENDEIVEVDAEKLENVLSLLQSRGGGVDGSLITSIKEMGLVLSEEFLVRVLETPHIPSKNLIAFFSWCLEKPNFSVKRDTIHALVRAVCSELKKNNAYALWDLLKDVGEKKSGLLSTEMLNELIALFSRLCKGRAAFEVLNKFEEFGCVADADTYYYTILALCRRRIFDLACSVSERMLSAGILPNAEKVGEIISYLSKGKQSRAAYTVYMSAKAKISSLPMCSVNHLISALCYLPKKDKASIVEEDKLYHENIYKAFGMLEDFSGEDRKTGTKFFCSVIRALCLIGDVDKAKGLLFKMIDAGPPPGNDFFNYVINGLSKAGDLDEAIKILNLMKGRGLKPDVYTYSVIISGYVKGGAMEEAHKLLEEAKKKHSKLSTVTYHTLIRGYCKLYQFDEAVKLLREMKDHGVRPTADEYNKLIQSLCLKSVDWGMAEKLLEEMQQNGLQLNGITKGLITAVKELEGEEGGSQEVAAAV